jgi:predicted NAD/FAD-binding protein
VNIRFDGTYSQLTIWKPWKSQIPVFKSWITYDTQLPEPLYAIAKYHHARVDAAYFYAQKALQAYQGRHNLWLAGTYMHDVDCHESAVLSGVKVAQALAPNSARLKQLTSTA